MLISKKVTFSLQNFIHMFKKEGQIGGNYGYLDNF